MNRKVTLKSHVISQAFVFLLLGLFAVFSTLMVLLGAQLYRGIVDQTEAHNARRVLYSYVNNAVRGNNAADLIHMEQIDGVDALVFDWFVDGEHYETKVYCHEGTLRELFSEAGEAFEPDYGEIICRAEAFRPEMEGKLLKLHIEDAEGHARTLHMALTCAGEEGL